MATLCPNCKIPLTAFHTGKDLTAFDGEDDLPLGRLNIMGCAKCGFVDEDSIWFT